MAILDWPSVADPNDEPDACIYCESDPDQPHQHWCPMAGPEVNANDVMFCDECGCSFVTCCPCGQSEDWR